MCDWKDVQVNSAYDEQFRNVERLCSVAGDHVVGYKAGLTSQASQLRYMAPEPIVGQLLDSRVLDSPAAPGLQSTSWSMLEPELVFRATADVDATMSADILASRVEVCAGIEIAVSRRCHPRDATVDSLVADNALAGGLVLATPWLSLEASRLPQVRVSVWEEGSVIGRGSGREISGGPLEALAYVVRFLASRDRTLLAGQIVAAGSLCGPIMPKSGATYTAQFSHGLGEVIVEISPPGCGSVVIA